MNDITAHTPVPTPTPTQLKIRKTHTMLESLHTSAQPLKISVSKRKSNSVFSRKYCWNTLSILSAVAFAEPSLSKKIVTWNVSASILFTVVLYFSPSTYESIAFARSEMPVGGGAGGGIEGGSEGGGASGGGADGGQ